MLHEPLVALLVILCLVFPLGIALFGFGWGLRSYRSRYEMENALAETRLEQKDRGPGVKAVTEQAPARVAAKQATRPPAKKTAKKASKKAAGKKAETPTAADNLTRINGIGPVMSRTLNEAGIHSFAQIAAWKKADIATFGELISSPGRIHTDDWIGQAKKLAREQSS